MATSLNLSRIDELKENAYSNIESYNDPDTPKALEQFTSQIKTILLADPKLLNSVPEYLPIALYGKVKFPPEAKLKWSNWIEEGIQPEWNDFKTTVAFNNAYIALAKRGILPQFNFLFQSAGFDIGETFLNFNKNHSYLKAFFLYLFWFFTFKLAIFFRL